MHKTVKVLSFIITSLVICKPCVAQTIDQPYNYQFNQKLSSELYSPQSSIHTSFRPLSYKDSALTALYHHQVDSGNHNKSSLLLNGHLFSNSAPKYSVYADILPEITAGADLKTGQEISSRGAGVQLGGVVGDRFSYHMAAYFNQAKLPDYELMYLQQIGVLPGQGPVSSLNGSTAFWTYYTGQVSYTANKFITLTLGHDKTFVGDGYRSLLLSDFSAPFTFFKVTAEIGQVQYTAMWANMQDPRANEVIPGNVRHKWAAFHYLDWNISKRLSLGFFDAVIWADRDENGIKRGFDFNYLNPVAFLRPLEASIGSPDNCLVGFTGKYKVSNGLTLYGQFALDEFESKAFFSNTGSYRNKYGYQLGIRGAHLFKIKKLNYLLEYNGVKPYTYTETSAIINYAQQGEPLAHPFGANFREAVSLLNYTAGKFDFSAEIDLARYGLDPDNLNYGKDIFLPYTDPVRTEGNYIGQGLTTNLTYFQFKTAYLLNPKTNLRLELNLTSRNEANSTFRNQAYIFTIGLKSSFRQFYNDIVSYKTH